MSNDALVAAWERMREGTEALGEAIKARSPEWQGKQRKARKKLESSARKSRRAARALLGRGRERVPQVVEAGRERVPKLIGRGKERVPKLIEAGRERVPQVIEAGRKRVPKVVRAGRERVPKVLVGAKALLPSIEIRRRRSFMDKLFSKFTVGFAVGYVLGARAGRERYDQLRRWWDSFAGNPTVQQAAEKGKEMVTGAGKSVADELRSRRGQNQSVRDVMTPTPQTVKTSASVADVARKMKESDAGAMVVVDEANRVVGIVTDRDLTIRAIADGKEPSSTPVSQVYSQDLTTVSPSDNVDRAVQLMRDRSLRRLPVVDGGRPVGIVSIGDLAVERDPSSALAEISARRPNR